MPELTVVDHPLVQHKLTLMRRKETSTVEFRQLVREVALLLCYEITRSLPLESRMIETPLETMEASVLAGKKLCIVSILRAGNGLLDGMLDLIPSARVGHIGLYRDPDTLEPVEYYYKVPNDIAERPVLVVDPMLATANSAVAAVEQDQVEWRARHAHGLPSGRSRGCSPFPRGAPGRARVHRRRRSRAQRPRLHSPRPRRRGRPNLRHEIGATISLNRSSRLLT